MELTNYKSYVHVDQGKEPDIGSKENIHQEPTEKSRDKTALIALNEGCRSSKYDQEIWCDTSEIKDTKHRGLKDKRKNNKYETGIT